MMKLARFLPLLSLATLASAEEGAPTPAPVFVEYWEPVYGYTDENGNTVTVEELPADIAAEQASALDTNEQEDDFEEIVEDWPAVYGYTDENGNIVEVEELPADIAAEQAAALDPPATNGDDVEEIVEDWPAVYGYTDENGNIVEVEELPPDIAAEQAAALDPPAPEEPQAETPVAEEPPVVNDPEGDSPITEEDKDRPVTIIILLCHLFAASLVGVAYVALNSLRSGTTDMDEAFDRSVVVKPHNNNNNYKAAKVPEVLDPTENSETCTDYDDSESGDLFMIMPVIEEVRRVDSCEAMQIDSEMNEGYFAV